MAKVLTRSDIFTCAHGGAVIFTTPPSPMTINGSPVVTLNDIKMARIICTYPAPAPGKPCTMFVCATNLVPNPNKLTFEQDEPALETVYVLSDCLPPVPVYPVSSMIVNTVPTGISVDVEEFPAIPAAPCQEAIGKLLQKAKELTETLAKLAVEKRPHKIKELMEKHEELMKPGL